MLRYSERTTLCLKVAILRIDGGVSKHVQTIDSLCVDEWADGGTMMATVSLCRGK